MKCIRLGFDHFWLPEHPLSVMFTPEYFRGKFSVSYDCNAPACEVVSMREWLINAESIAKGLAEIHRVMEARIADGAAHQRESSALVHVREARNLLRTSMVLVSEDADASGVKASSVDLTGLKVVAPAHSGKSFHDFEVYCANELAYMAGLFGGTLHVHYLAHHPEAMPNRHWMIMQALSGSFQRLLLATADMSVADKFKNGR